MIELFYQLFLGMCELLKEVETGKIGSKVDVEMKNSKGPNIVFTMQTSVVEEKKKTKKKTKKVSKK